MTRYLTSIFCPVLVSVMSGTSSYAHADSDSWEGERWEVQPFTQALGGGPETGPVIEAGTEISAICGDEKGNMFVVSGQYVDIVTPDGNRHHLAGTGYPGYRDGQASLAEFRFTMSSKRKGYGRHNLACDHEGSVYVADDGNKMVRRIFKADSGWQVDTIAGGGEERLAIGQSARPPTRANLANSPLIALGPHGALYISTRHGYFTVTPDRKTITFSGHWSETGIPARGKLQLQIVKADSDNHGNAYFVSRGPDVVVRVTADGKIEHIGGIVFNGPTKPLHIGDGPPLEAYFNTPGGMATDPGGTAVYLGGGDEYEFRRVPTDGQGETRTLLQNGTWGRFPKHPNNYRGPAYFTPELQGKPRPQGRLKAFMVGHLLGKDQQGNVYSDLPPWRGATQYIEKQGLLPTRIFRLHRVTK